MKIPVQICWWVLTVGFAVSTDPLLLEYSDYYYDLYYGDYDDYSPGRLQYFPMSLNRLDGLKHILVEEVHSTAPRSIRVEKPVNLKDDQEAARPARSNRRGNRAKLAENEPDHPQIQHSPPSPPPVEEAPAPVIEPLNVRLQRLLSHDQSSAQTILDILEAPRQSQEEIIKFLRHVVDRIQEEERSSSNNFQQNQRQPQDSRPVKRPPPPTRPQTKTRPPPLQTRPPPTRPPPPPTRPPPPPTRPPPPSPTRPPPPSPTRPPPPPPTRPPPPPPTRPPPPPTRPPPPPTTAPPPTFRSQNQNFRDPKSSRVDSENPNTAHQTVNSQFSQFPNFQNHLQSNRGDDDTPEIPRRSEQERDKPRNSFHVTKFDENERERNFQNQIPKHQNFRNQNQPVRVQPIQNESRRPAANPDNDKSRESPHSPTSSSGLTIEEFLSRYPEVKRLSSRFGDETAPNTEAPFKSHKKQKFAHNKGKNKKSHNNRHNGNNSPGQQSNFIPFNVPDTTPATAPPRITPRQRQTEVPTPPPTRRPPPTPKTTQPPPPPPPPPTHRPAQKQQKKNNNKKNKHSKNKQQNFNVQEQQQADQLASYDDYGIDNLDYDYYYDQLVPEHERFFQLPKTESATPDPIVEQTDNQPGSFQVFTHFTNDNSQVVNNKEVPPPPPPPKKKHKPKPKSSGGGSKANSVGPPINKPGGPQAGPFGYTDKGTYFEDSHFNGFPERIEMIYQGFVWAMDMFYPGQDSVLHGGVHTILKDKVKQETVNLEGDYIVRVSGRASPYNINRLTFYTKNGQKFGPWGDRHSDDSVDFDVSAPPGQALAFFSGTIDFGVPLRSVSFHWRPIS